MKMEDILGLSFNEIMANIEVLKSYYRDIITSFSYFDLKKKNAFKRQIKKTIYALQFEQWKKDLIWEKLNDDWVVNYETSNKIND